MSTDKLNDIVRAAFIAVVLLAVVALALWLRSEAAAGALLSGLAAAAGYLFRGRVVSPTGTITDQPSMMPRGTMGNAGKPQ